MTLNELQEKALKLPSDERWQLINALMRSLQSEPSQLPKPKGLAVSLVGLAKTDGPLPH
jgi:hypothetical protein